MAPPPRRTAILIVLTALVALGPTSTDLYLPSVPSLATHFESSISQAQLTLSAFTFGMAVGTLLYGPASDRFGRRPPLIVGLVVYTLANVACAMADGIGQLIALRFASAVGGCAGAVIARAIVRDLFGRDEAARALSYMSAAMALCPALAPIFGGFVHVTYGWRGQFVVLAIVGAVLGFAALLLPETNRLRNPGAVDPGRIARNIATFFRHRVFVGCVLLAALGYGGLFSFISASSFVVTGVLGVAPRNFGYLFMFVSVGFMTGALVGGRLSRRYGIAGLLTAGAWTAAAAGLGGLALSLAGVVTIPAVIGPVALTFFSAALVLPSAMAGAMAPFPDLAGTASSTLSGLQMASAAAIGAITGLMLDGTTVPLFIVTALTGVLQLVVLYVIVRRDPEFTVPRR